MRNLWLVAKHEYRRTVVRRGFLIGTLAVPLGLAVLIALAIAVETAGQNRSPVGYVDHAGLLVESRQAALPNATERIAVRAFNDEAAAQAALEREEIQALFVLPEDYARTLRTQLYYLERPPSEDAWRDFDDFVRLNLVAGLPQAKQRRLMEGAAVTVVDLGSGREFSEQGIINVILPVAASVLFFVTTMSAGGHMLRVVADEKENRTMEVMLTSLTPAQFIAGKTLGLLAAALTQLGVYVLAVVVGLFVAAPYVEQLRQVTVPWAYLGVMALFFLPSYALISAIMVAVGAAVPDLQQGQQLVGLLNLIFWAPLFLIFLIFEDPGQPAVVALTLFPTSAFLTISLRWGLGVVPLWQLGVSWLVLVAVTAGMVWVAARVFRAGMLHYGQPLTPRAVWAALRSAG